jgi:hypothetical protein
MPGKQIRYRKFNMMGSTAVVFTGRNEKLMPREFQFESPKEKAEMAINIKLIEADYYQKYKIDNGIKSLLRAYDENRKRNSAEGMNRLGLDIIKIKSFSNNNINHKLVHSSDSAPKIAKQDSVKAIDHKYILEPIKIKSGREVASEEKNWVEGESQFGLGHTSTIINLSTRDRDSK